MLLNINGIKDVNIEAVQRILFVNCTFNKSISYVQGMHEICGLIYYVFSQANEKQEIAEALSYFGFTTFIVRFRDWFDRTCDNRPTGLKECFKTIGSILKLYDVDLWNHFEEEGVDLMCGCFRWISVFFIENYTLEEILKVWDVILCSFDSSQLLLEIICVAVSMIESLKDKLMKSDSSQCLKMLMNFQQPSENILKRTNKIKKFVVSKHIYLDAV